jgi:hypothetical protein
MYANEKSDEAIVPTKGPNNGRQLPAVSTEVRRVFGRFPDAPKAVYNLRGDDGVSTGGLAVDSNQGWKGPNKHVATVPQVFDLWQDPQERYDVFMNNYTERTWTLVTMRKVAPGSSSPSSSSE